MHKSSWTMRYPSPCRLACSIQLAEKRRVYEALNCVAVSWIKFTGMLPWYKVFWERYGKCWLNRTQNSEKCLWHNELNVLIFPSVDSIVSKGLQSNSAIHQESSLKDSACGSAFVSLYPRRREPQLGSASNWLTRSHVHGVFSSLMIHVGGPSPVGGAPY